MRIAAPIYPTQQGLGVLAKSFVDHGVITHPYAVLHTSHPNLHAEWYPGVPSGSIREPHRILSWISSIRKEIDAVLCFETPFALDLFPLCRRLGIRTVLVPMYECFHAGQAAHPPDLYLCPSTLDYQYFAKRCTTCRGDGYLDTTTATNERWRTKKPCPKHAYLPVPVEVPWRQRERVYTFVHNAGHGSFQDRNGTQLLLEAWPLVKSAARLILRSQGAPNTLMNLVKSTRNVDVRIGSAPYESLWDEGDAFVFVERWNGACLPLQEARASGMLVIAGDRAPMNEWLPTEPLVKPSGYEATRIGPPYPTVEAAQYDPKDVAAMIDRRYDTNISAYSLSGREWAGEMSWEKLKPRWLEAIAG